MPEITERPEIPTSSLINACAAIARMKPRGGWNRTNALKEGDRIRVIYKQGGSILEGTFTNPTGTIGPLGPRVRFCDENGQFTHYQVLSPLVDDFLTWEKIVS